jgi:hypothetical protein
MRNVINGNGSDLRRYGLRPRVEPRGQLENQSAAGAGRVTSRLDGSVEPQRGPTRTPMCKLNLNTTLRQQAKSVIAAVVVVGIALPARPTAPPGFETETSVTKPQGAKCAGGWEQVGRVRRRRPSEIHCI